MLLTITDKCTMGCSHCSENCTLLGEHMTMETFKDVFKFISAINPMVVIVTGGEPTLHPNFFEIMKTLIKRFGKERVCVTSNGLFYTNEDKTLNTKEFEKYMSLGVMFQITNDSRYYPTYVPFVNHPLIAYEDKIRHIYPLGRAVTNNIESYGCNAPKCFNIRSIARSMVDLVGTIRTLELKGKFCTPSIDINGNIKAGEFNACNSVGTVKDYQMTIYNNIKNLKCNNCKMEDKLSPLHLSVIK